MASLAQNMVIESMQFFGKKLMLGRLQLPTQIHVSTRRTLCAIVSPL